MAARINKVVLSEAWRDKIRVSMLINRLQACAAGRIDMSSQQIRAAEILIRKRLPDLTATELTGPNGGPVEVNTTPLSTDEGRAILDRINEAARAAVSAAGTGAPV